MKQTALTHTHERLGAKMVSYAGYKMPVHYKGVKAEHTCVRTAVGVFDVSHMGELLLRGEKALALLQRISSNDAAKMAVRQAQYAYMPNEEGGVVDDMIIYKKSEEEYLLVVNAANIEKDRNWIAQHNTFGVELIDLSAHYALLAVQGPKATEVMQPLTQLDLRAMRYYTFDEGTFAGVDNVLVSATGYTGAGGFEVYVKSEAAEKVWNAILSSGEEWGIQPIGLAARDTLRLEMGYCLYGNDIDDRTSPLEAGLGWVTKFTKDFVNAAALKAQKEAGVQRKLVGFEMVDKGIPRQHYAIVDQAERTIGEVTSGTMSPSLNKAIGLGYVAVEWSRPDTLIYLHIRGKKVGAKVVQLPFYKGT